MWSVGTWEMFFFSCKSPTWYSGIIQILVWILTPQLISCLTLEMLFDISKPQCWFSLAQWTVVRIKWDNTYKLLSTVHGKWLISKNCYNSDYLARSQSFLFWSSCPEHISKWCTAFWRISGQKSIKYSSVVWPEYNGPVLLFHLIPYV